MPSAPGADLMAQASGSLTNEQVGTRMLEEMVQDPAMDEIWLRMFKQMVLHGNQAVLTEVAESPHCPPDLLGLLSMSSSAVIQRAVADNPNTPSDVLQHMVATDRNLQYTVIRNPSTSAATLEWLLGQATDDDWILRFAVAGHPNCPQARLIQWASDPDCAVRTAVAHNPNCPPDLLCRFLQDPEPEVRSQALYNPSLPEEYKALARISQ